MKFLLNASWKICRLVIVLLTSCFTALNAQTLVGYAIDADNNKSLAGVIITVIDLNRTRFYKTGADGTFTINLPPNTYSISCVLKGYKAQVVNRTIVANQATKPVEFKLVSNEDKASNNYFTSSNAKGGLDNRGTEHSEQKYYLRNDYEEQMNRNNGKVMSHGKPFNKSFIVSPGVGYTMGEIGGITGHLDLSLSRLFGGYSSTSMIFLSLQAGGESEYYKSNMFNDITKDYQFDFLRASLGIGKVFSIQKILIVPQVAVGMERATPKTNGVNDQLDGGYLQVEFIHPSFSLGYAFSQKIAVILTTTYYATSKETINKNNEIFGKKDTETNTWIPWSYSDDFFKNRRGFSLNLGMNFYL